jgi:hypothetical protein
VYNFHSGFSIFSSQTASSFPVGKKGSFFISPRFLISLKKFYRTVSPLFPWDFIDSYFLYFFLPQDKKSSIELHYIYISFFLFNFADKISQNNISPYLILQIYIPAFENITL